MFFILLALFACWQSIGLEIGTFAKPGPGFFCFFSGLALGCFAVIIFFTSRFSKTLTEITRKRYSWTPLVLTFGSLVGFTLFLNTLGFKIATFLLIGFLLKTVEKKGWIIAVVVALSATAGAYLLFDFLLQTHLPEGLLGF